MRLRTPCRRGKNGEPCGRVPADGEAYDPARHCRICFLNGQPRNPTDRPHRMIILRQVRCLHLAKRVEFKQGCGGMRCRHECEKELPAVPGIFCQTCEVYEPDAGAWI